MHSILKLAKKLLAVAAVAGVFASAHAALPPLGPSLDDAALESYVRAATVQMQTYRWELAEAARSLPAGDERQAVLYERVQLGEQLIIRLRSAHPNEVQGVKADFEKNRAELDRLFGRDRAEW